MKLNATIPPQAQTQEGVAAAGAFLDVCEKLESPMLDTNNSPEHRAMSLMCSAVQFLIGAIGERTDFPGFGQVALAGAGLGLGGNAGMMGRPELFGPALELVVDGFREGYTRSIELTTPKGPVQ